MLEVHELGPEAVQQAGQRPCHAQLLGLRRQLDRLDTARDEVGPPGHRRELEVGRDERQLAQQVEDVRLLAGAVAEALACGCPIVTSQGSAMAEIAGDDATYVNPADVESIRAGIAAAAAPPPRRGPDWDEVAARTRSVYEEVA